ncbi:ATP-binding protein [Pseudorhodoferax sp. LjRoot39]|uniref:YncE family protein n=1 Tax=Pseudorhodoferax sp. LjRoot39 TaxID=3342328 RepID=UPI003ED0A6B0
MNTANRPYLTRPPWSASALIALTLMLGACAASPQFQEPAAKFQGRISVVDTPQVIPGAPVKIAGRGFVPGQQVQLTYAGTALGAPATADAEGNFRTEFAIPGDAPPGQHPVVVNATRPVAAVVHPLKVSPNVPLSGQEQFNVTSQPLVQGLYQVAYSARNDRLYVTSAVGRPPVTQSALLKVHPQTLAIEARATPKEVPQQAGQQRAPGVFAVYGVAVDDANDTLWVTNTRQDTVAVYRQADLSLVKQFEVGSVAHSRDVVVDAARGKAFASAAGAPLIKVFDTKTLQPLPDIKLETTVKGPDAKPFSPFSLAFDAPTGKLYTVSLNSAEVAVIDTTSGRVEKVFVVDSAQSTIGVAYDPKTRRLFVAAQGSDNLLIVDPATGKTLHNVLVGAGTHNVAVDSARGQVYVSNRGAGTVTVVSVDGKIIANLPGGTFPNHVAGDGKGTFYAINKSRGADDPQGDRITRIAPR